ncbi:insulin-like peptide receptor isoform X2 [Agrilus planipennis]|nr:insulin-like peptide receptor isoform X2 [Agrilus planipennis]
MPRGKIYIQRCPKLCHIDTVDWTAIGTEHPTVMITADEADVMRNRKPCSTTCPSNCKTGHCWNENVCQITRSKSCPNDCSICTEESKSIATNSCMSCNYLTDNGLCVRSCPRNKFLHTLLYTCVTEKECTSILDNTWWTFQQKCINSCPQGFKSIPIEQGGCESCHGRCEKWCHADPENDFVILVDTTSEAQKLGGCTHINGSLSIRIDTKSLAEELVNHLGKVEEITGFLKVSRSYHITSLMFLKSLKVIHGRVVDNRRHSLVIYENQNLRELWNWNKFSLAIKNGTISFHYNPQLCLKEIEKLAEMTNLTGTYTDIDVTPDSNGDKTACNYVDLHAKYTDLNPTNVTLKWDHFRLHENDSLINYAVYYMERDATVMTTSDAQDECSGEGWNSVFVSSNTAVISNLEPFTEYAFYIKMYVSIPSHGGQTNVTYFRTAPDDPSQPREIVTEAINSSTIRIKWLPPLYPNGNLSHYHVLGFLEPDDPKFIAQRDYCLYPPEDTGKQPVLVQNSSLINSTKNVGDCNCSIETAKITKEEFDVLCDSIVSVYSGNESLINSGSCKRFMYIQENRDLYRNYQSGPVKAEDYRKEDHYIDRIVPANETNLDISGLRRFSMYVFLISACNPDYKGKPQCSSPILVFKRTSKDEKSDDIRPDPVVTVEGSNVVLKWQQPRSPNSIIVAYRIEHKKTDIENTKPAYKCVTADNHIRNGNTYTIKNLLPGEYTVRVKAISLAGAGNFGNLYKFEIDDDSKPRLWIIPFMLIILTVLILLLLLYAWYKRKHKMDMLHLIASINPDYAGPVYVEDEWEIDREDVEILNPLGKGTFGMVYNGRIKSKNLDCAIKTVNESAKMHDRMEFLNEAAVMKAFSDAHHVVKLYGVVSRGNIPLVIMELMQRGDLKSYLRRSRDSSNSINCAEMYRMATEIADGMAYLAAKKFVHRDLAARNCMVSADRTVKIGDFGMTRDIYETDYYRKESRGLLPVRWMAPESLADGIFTSDSDVWSYGVVLWEMATLAEQPYQGLANEQVLQFVIAKGTLDRPPDCPDLLYEIMVACWKWRPYNRPQFIDIVQKLESHVGQNFRLVSFYHSREGEEFRLNSKERVQNMPALGVRIDQNSGVHWTSTSDDEVSISSDQPSELLSYSHQRQTQSPSGSSNLQ